ncbi:MAG: ATP-binding cassette domain-containing protein [Pseudomonadota bacterium]
MAETVGLTAQGLGFRVAERWLLRGINLSLQPGRLLAVVGPNGAGKSTLLRCLSGAQPASAGQVSLDGRLLADWPGKALARRRAVLPQAPPRGGFGLAASDLVALGRAPALGEADAAPDGEVIAAALSLAGVGHLAARSLTVLSGGELQRVDLARVLAQIWEARPPRPSGYLLLDEPTASLDLVQQGRVLGLARQLADQGYGVLAIVHDLTAALRMADEALLLAEGRAVAQGPVASAMQAPLLSKAFGAALQVGQLSDGGQVVTLAREKA